MISKDLSKSFNPVPKNKRIVDKKLLKDKKRDMWDMSSKRVNRKTSH